MLTIIDYLDQLSLEYTQLCQRRDGSIYGIESGLQCRKGTPISYNPNLAKQVREKEKDRLATIVIKAKAIGLTNKDIKTIGEEVKSELKIKNIRGQDALKLFAKKANQLSKNKRQGQSISFTREEALEKSKRYDKIPGSTQPIPKKTREEYVELAKEMLKDPYHSRDFNLERFTYNQYVDLPLALSYRVQEFNSKPELVPTVEDLMKRKDVLRKDDGNPIIFYRGSTEEYISQFLGVGEQGNIHGAGMGVWGNGTYAAAVNKGWGGNDSSAKNTAIDYARPTDNSFRKAVATFALRQDANIVEIDNKSDLIDWQSAIMKEAEKATGFRFSDPGHAAAAMGIHAYKVKGGYKNSPEVDYWVILNRGVVVATIEEFEEFED